MEQPRKPESNSEIISRQINQMIKWLTDIKERSYNDHPDKITWNDRREISKLHTELYDFITKRNFERDAREI